MNVIRRFVCKLVGCDKILLGGTMYVCKRCDTDLVHRYDQNVRRLAR